MIISRPKRQRAFALLVVMIVVISLGILAIGFAYSMKVETELARNASVASELEWMGRSGIELARYVLTLSGQGPTGQFDALNQRWAGGLGDTNGPLAEIPLEDYPLGRGSISVKIIDQDRKFNINVADEVILSEALGNVVGLEATDVDLVVHSILDWRDRDDQERLSGAESDFYLNRNVPHFAKDGPIDDLSELLWIQGITPALYYGGSGGGGEGLPLGILPSQPLDAPEEGFSVGLKDLFTTLSSQRINVNTASASTMMLMPYVDEIVAGNIISERAGYDGVDGTDDDTPFRNIGELGRVPGMNPAALQLMQRYFGVRSAVFEVRVEARIGEQTRTYVAMLRRGGRGAAVTLMFMYWE